MSGTFGGETFRFDISQAASKKVKVTFGKNGGTGGDDYVTATYGQPMPTPRTAPEKDRYVFDGYWDTTGAGGKQYYDANMNSVRNWDKTSPTTLWAKWTIPRYKVTFGKNGGSGGDDYVTATTGQAMPTPRRAPTKDGWSFGGYWDTLACDARGNPKGKQYYNAKMESVRSWDKTAAGTLWAKWTCRVKLGKNGGTGGDDYVTVIYGQPFPTRTMPTKSGYAFGGYFVSASAKTGQCYNADGTGTSTMKWTTGGSPTIWALWNRGDVCVDCGSSSCDFTDQIASTAGERHFTLTNVSSYTSFSTSVSWVTSKRYVYSSRNLTVYYTVTENTSSSKRTAVFSGKVNGQDIEVCVEQAGK